MTFFTRKSINLDITNKCTLACPLCARRTFIKKGIKIPGREMTIEEFNKVLNFFDHIIFCGQVSDPILHSRFLDFLKMVKDRNSKCDIHTAVSHKPKKFYIDAFNQNPNAKWIFGIDGLPKDSHKYRVRQDGLKMFNMMLEAKNIGCDVEWQYIVFNYNENDLEEARGIAKSHGIILNVIYSNRFQYNDEMKPNNKQYYVG